MTDTTTLAPTDEEIIAWAMSHQTDAIKTLRASGFVRIARAVLAKWGAPAPASQPVAVPAGMEPVAWVEVHPGLDGWFLAYSFNPDAKTEPLYTAAQVQAMLAHGVAPQLPAGQPSPAERKPLTLEQIGDAARAAHIAFCLDKFPTFEHAIVHFTEQAHGITATKKGGQDAER